MKNLLVEIFVEELPPKALQALGDAFAAKLFEALERNDFLEPGAVATAYATPRRLAAHVTRVRALSQPRPQPPATLMPEAVGLQDGRPTAPLRKRLARLGYPEGVDVEALLAEGRIFRAEEGGKTVLKHREDQASGTALQVGLEAALDAALQALPIPKVMQYQLADGWTSVSFVRPAHGLVALHGAEVVPVTALGLAAGRETHGHRFEAAAEPIRLRDADSYAQQLAEEGAVIAGYAERRAEIARQLQAAATEARLAVMDDAALLDEVTALVERPNVLACEFDRDFLAVPPECLVLTMKANQKYFPLLGGKGELTNRFLVVSNIRPADPARIVEGNERVVRPRLADAKFFYDQDRRATLASRVAALDQVVYHGQLGTQGERVGRVRAIVRAIGAALGGAELAAAADRAAELAKADLLTGMVGEFPELQGIMGRYYALHDGEPEAVAQAIEDHYRPRFAGDALPGGEVGLAVALADKLETLVGLFSIGQLPSGDRDPYALRRHALGVVRMLVERELPLDLRGLLGVAQAQFEQRPSSSPGAAPGSGVVEAVHHFILERLAGLLREQGHDARAIDAVLALEPQRLADVPRRLEAVRAFAALPEAEALAAANKRVGNILKKAGGEVAPHVDAALLHEAAELGLQRALLDVAPAADADFERGDYTASLRRLAALRSPVDAFFDAVMVNAEDAALRANRLGLLATLHHAMNRIADLARLA